MVYDDDLPTKNAHVPFRELVNQQRVDRYSLKEIQMVGAVFHRVP